ncbi:MAG: acetyltransferase [Burkholderiales bacterium]|nr:acetyltransferase [Burkholderiales bacterium]
MTAYDIFNGDADGLFALHQLRLARPCGAVLVTGVKRDIALLRHVDARAGDQLTVLDIALSENIDALRSALRAGASCSWFDHHFSGEVPRDPLLDVHIHHAPDTCTSLIVDGYIGGAHRAWAVSAAFGDNVPHAAVATARRLGLAQDRIEALAELGRLVNYNAYGESLDELHVHPEQLYRRLQGYADPFDFIAAEPCLARLREGYRDDMARARAQPALIDGATHFALVLPDEAWARRVSGTLANELARTAPERAHAVLTRTGALLTVSIRAPLARPQGAVVLARLFRGGGGRSAAAGINRLPDEELGRFLNAFCAAFT